MTKLTFTNANPPDHITKISDTSSGLFVADAAAAWTKGEGPALYTKVYVDGVTWLVRLFGPSVHCGRVRLNGTEEATNVRYVDAIQVTLK